MSNLEAFDVDVYHAAQVAAFSERTSDGEIQVIEFGGKPFGDYHAARVLPGYHPDIKAHILSDLIDELGNTTLAIAVNSRDLLLPPDGRRTSRRIRGDTGLRYDEEVIRLSDQARTEFGLPMDTVVLTATPQVLASESDEYLAGFRERLALEGLAVREIGAIAKYPYVEVTGICQELTQFDPIARPGEHLIVTSPGGGSGKFSVAVTEIAHHLQAGRVPNFTKFETFPVFSLDNTHPLNVAFLAATADLPNALVRTKSGKTNYDKDVQNLSLLQTLVTQYPNIATPIHNFEEPTDMGVNVIEQGIVDEARVAQACMEEIVRRITRYKREQQDGDESHDTVARTVSYLLDAHKA